jgi:hypothetical protein
MHGNPDLVPLVLFSIYGPLGIVAIALGSIITRYRRTMHAQRVGSELVQEMLRRDMSADDIERVLLAWHADPSLASKLTSQPPLKKYAA